MESQKLFCFPYAGGNTDTIYCPWKKYLNPNIELIPVEYPGHGKRIMEPLSKNLKELVSGLFHTIIKYEIDEHTNYMIYGHSMGTIVVYELLKLIKENQLLLPHTLFLSGRYSPHVVYQKENTHLLSNEQLINNLIQLGGVPSEIRSYPELMNICLPIIRNDYQIIDEYELTMPISCFNSNIVFIYSDNDPYLENRKKVNDWGCYTDQEFLVIEVEGDHFFINDKAAFICHLINESAK